MSYITCYSFYLLLLELRALGVETSSYNVENSAAYQIHIMTPTGTVSPLAEYLQMFIAGWTIKQLSILTINSMLKLSNSPN